MARSKGDVAGTGARASGRISSDAVATATGKGWDAWFAALDAAEAGQMGHPDIVAWLRRHGGLGNAWWQQMVAVEYERARGLRAVGETAATGYEIGVQRTLPADAGTVWAALMEPPGLMAWLGEVQGWSLEPGARFHAPDGADGEVRTVQDGERVRLAWQPDGWPRASTIQLTVVPRGDRATVRFHHEHLPDAAAREAMRERWKRALAALAKIVQDG